MLFVTNLRIFAFFLPLKQGYVDAALAFQRESGTDPGVDLAAITDRMEIRKAVQGGDVETAIGKVNDLNPEILEEHSELLFHLKQQRLIELIRNGAVDEALEFAQEQLAPQGEDNPAFLQELERTVALLVFDDPGNSPMGDLLDSAQRARTASELNAAILASQSQAGKPKLPNLLKFLVWAQEQLETKAEFPKMDDLVVAKPVRAAELEPTVEEMIVATEAVAAATGAAQEPMEVEAIQL